MEKLEYFLDIEQKFYDFDGEIPLLDSDGNKRLFESLVDADINFIFTFLTKTAANGISYCYPKSLFSPDFDYSYGQKRRCILAKYKRNKKTGIVETRYLYPVYLKRNPQLVQKEFDYILTDKQCREVVKSLLSEGKINLAREKIEKLSNMN